MRKLFSAGIIGLVLAGLITVSASDVLAGPTPKVRLVGDIEKIESEVIKESVRKIQRRFENRGNKRTTHWNEVITRLEAIHERLDRQRERFKRRSKGTVELTKLIRDARQKRNRTKQLIMQQDLKQYSLVIRNESLIGTRILALQQTEKADLLAVQEKVTEAIGAYKLALEEVKKVKASAPLTNN